MAVEIIEATLEDLDMILKWRMEVISVVFKGQDYSKDELYKNNRDYFINAFNKNTVSVVFARENNEISGCGTACLYNELPSPDNPTGLCAYLMNIYVREEYRHQGTGRKIIRNLVQKARKRGITKIYLESTKEAVKFYEEMGFREMKDFLIL